MKFCHRLYLCMCLWCGAITIGMSNGYHIARDLSLSQTQVRCTETPLCLFPSGSQSLSNHHSRWGECTWFVTSAASHSVIGALHSVRSYLWPTIPGESLCQINSSTAHTHTHIHTHQCAATQRIGSDSSCCDKVYSCVAFSHNTTRGPIFKLKNLLTTPCMRKLRILSLR